MLEAHGHVGEARAQVAREALGEVHRAVLAAGTAERDAQVLEPALAEVGLAQRFIETFKKFEAGCPPEVAAAGPKLEEPAARK